MLALNFHRSNDQSVLQPRGGLNWRIKLVLGLPLQIQCFNRFVKRY